MSAIYTWFELREPGCSPVLKGPFPSHDFKDNLREFMRERPRAFITVMAIEGPAPIIQDGPECLEILDGRMAGLARRHRESTRRAFADGQTGDAK